MAASSPGISRFRWGMSAVLTISMVSVIALLITTLTVLDIRRERAIFNSELEERGLLMAETLNDVLADPVYFSDIDGVRDIVEVVRGQPDIAYVRIFRPDGRLLVDGPRLGRVHTKRSASKMSANEMNPRKITSSFSKREKMRRNPFNRRNSLSISLRLLYISRSYSHG